MSATEITLGQLLDSLLEDKNIATGKWLEISAYAKNKQVYCNIKINDTTEEKKLLLFMPLTGNLREEK